MSIVAIVFIICVLCGTGGRSKNPNPKISDRPFPLNKNPILKFFFSFRMFFIFGLIPAAYLFEPSTSNYELATTVLVIWLLLPGVKIFWWMYR